MDIQFAHMRLSADDAYPPLPSERAYAVVVIAHEETSAFWRRGLAERMATGACVQANIWGEDSEDWENDINAANALAIMTEERAEYFPDIVVSCQSMRPIDDVFDFATAHMGTTEAEELSLLIVLEIGTPAYQHNLQAMAYRSAAEFGAMARLAC
ncbi:hypothetical protein BVC71_04015 [Marivivens niveibacter]|uniref:DUF7684 domain-containing protein n=1 Tax=Marivivens niveibacter TaxID=1930667 RepID=A0A251X3C0_9RHOB|nr:hypothetical protein [Marivivens niveibacter]OUD10663.1 hypothetical protein BVC71_04015 [Marivivens niveibacter]